MRLQTVIPLRKVGLPISPLTTTHLSTGSGSSDNLSNYKGKNYAFTCPVELRFVDMDMMGHINNAVYFTMFENARLIQMKQLGATVASPSPENPIQPILASTSCRFKAPITYHDPVQVGVHIEPVDDNSYEQRFAVFNEKTQRVVAEGHALIVFINYTTGKRVKVPEKFLNAALELQETKEPTQ